MSDVLCDFCHRAWSEEMPFVEGHQGSHICGRCLSVAFAEIDGAGPNVVTADYQCRLSLESDDDRTAQNRTGEAGWRSPIDQDAVISRMCIRMAAVTLERDATFEWSRPE